MHNAQDSTDVQQVVVKATVNKSLTFHVTAHSFDFGRCCLDESSASECRLTVSNLKRAARVFLISCSPQLARADGSAVPWLAQATFSLEHATADGADALMAQERDREERLEKYERKLRIAKRKQRWDKVGKIESTIAKLKSSLNEPPSPAPSDIDSDLSDWGGGNSESETEDGGLERLGRRSLLNGGGRAADGREEGESNLLRFRLTGHGYAPEEGKSGEELHRGGVAVAERQSHLQLRRDAAAAFALGRLLGERVVLVGCSTGGSLAVWLSGQPWVQRKIAAIVLVSPAFRLTAPYAVWVVFSWLILLSPRAVAALILRGFNGFHTLKRPSPKLTGDRGAAQARCWTRAWPIEAVRHVIGLYVVVRATVSYAKIRVPVLAFANPKDGAVSFEATREAVGRMKRGELEVVTDSENRHVITGAILSPSTVERVTRRAVDFCVMETADDFADAADIDAPPAAAGAAGPGPSLSKMK